MGRLGYAIEKENQASLMANGVEPKLLMQRYKEQFPAFNASADMLDIINVLDQGQVGSCQGQSLCKMFQICFYLATGRIVNFSAMCGYIIAQRFDGLDGRDVGSTLSGGQRVATEHGMCLEADWRYTGRYDSSVPNVAFPFKLASAQPTNDPALIKEALSLGLPVQTGMAWNNELERERVESYTGAGAQGGHATSLWLDKHLNSWGSGWNGDGLSSWSDRALEQIVTHRGNTFVIYAPDGMDYPDLEPINPTE